LYVSAGAVIRIACTEQGTSLIEIIARYEVAYCFGTAAGRKLVVLEGSGTERGVLPVDIFQSRMSRHRPSGVGHVSSVIGIRSKPEDRLTLSDGLIGGAIGTGVHPFVVFHFFCKV